MYITLRLIYHLQQYDKASELNDELGHTLPLLHLFHLGTQDHLSTVLKIDSIVLNPLLPLKLCFPGRK